MKKWITAAIVLCLMGTLHAQNKKQTAVEVGQKAPELAVQDVSNKLVKLENLEGKKVLLSFLRYAGCPVCHYRIHELKAEYEAMAAMGWEVVLVFETPAEQLAKYQAEFDFTFVLIADPENTLYDRYAIERSTGKMFKTAGQKEVNERFKKGKELYTEKYKRDGKMNRIGADFVIGPDSKVILTHYGAHIGDHIPLNELLTM